jgi:uncharacterized protein YndB with AHSA1/START domain
MRIDISVDIDAPAERVFALMVDIAGWPRIIRAIEHVEILTSGPVAVGTRFRETRMMHGRRATEELTVDALEPPHRFRLIATGHGTRYVATQTIAQTGSGCRLDLVFEAMPLTLFARLFAFLGTLLRGRLAAAMQSDLDDIKSAAEGRDIVDRNEKDPTN